MLPISSFKLKSSLSFRTQLEADIDVCIISFRPFLSLPRCNHGGEQHFQKAKSMLKPVFIVLKYIFKMV